MHVASHPQVGGNQCVEVCGTSRLCEGDGEVDFLVSREGDVLALWGSVCEIWAGFGRMEDF